MLVRPHYRNAFAVTVNRFTGRNQIRHFVMAITAADACDDFVKYYANVLRSKAPRRSGASQRTHVQEE